MISAAFSQLLMTSVNHNKEKRRHSCNDVRFASFCMQHVHSTSCIVYNQESRHVISQDIFAIS